MYVLLNNIVHNNVHTHCTLMLLPNCRDEVLISAGDEEATDIGELLSSCHQYCVIWWSPITRFRSCWCVSTSTSTTTEENWLVHTINRNNLKISTIIITTPQFILADWCLCRTRQIFLRVTIFLQIICGCGLGVWSDCGCKMASKVGYVSSSSAGMLTTSASSPPDMLANEVYLSLFQFSMIQLLVGADKAANFRGGLAASKGAQVVALLVSDLNQLTSTSVHTVTV